MSFRLVDASMDALISSPFFTTVYLTARITRTASSRTKCRAASSPRPVLEPVTMMVWPLKDVVGIGMDCRWARIDVIELMLAVFYRNWVVECDAESRLAMMLFPSLNNKVQPGAIVPQRYPQSC